MKMGKRFVNIKGLENMKDKILEYLGLEDKANTIEEIKELNQDK